MSKEEFLTLLQANRIPLFFASIGLVLIGIGIASTVISENKNQGLLIEEAAFTTRENGVRIVVDVAGAVERPGVYTLSEGARLQEALIAAGGIASNADREYISKNINLAVKVSDGAKIYIPSRGESPTGIKSTTGITGSGGSVAGAVAGMININSASASELDTLPGVGPVTAEKIINNRPYGSVDELLTKKIVGQKVFGEIRDRLSVY